MDFRGQKNSLRKPPSRYHNNHKDNIQDLDMLEECEVPLWRSAVVERNALGVIEFFYLSDYDDYQKFVFGELGGLDEALKLISQMLLNVCISPYDEFTYVDDNTSSKHLERYRIIGFTDSDLVL
jgi:hypothetical protein